MIRLAMALAATAALAAAVPAASAQEDCPRGQLDKRYCDRDGDMTADAPVDPKLWVDPPTLIFAYTPVEDPEVYRSVWDGFLQHLAKATGKRVQFFPIQSNAAQIEAMRAGRLHIAGFNTGSNPVAVNCAGNVPFAMMAAKDGAYGYEMEIITHVDSPIREIKDLKGRKLAFTAPTSNSGFKAPSALLQNDYGLEAGKDYQTAFSGKHDNSVLGVVNRDYDAAAIANEVMIRMGKRGVIDRAKIRTIYKSETFPTTGYGHAYNLKPELAAKVKEAFFSFPWTGSGLAKEFGNAEPPMEQFVAISYKQHWAAVRKYDELTGVRYECKS
ncbi:MAG: phosphate/phosphite/phosphonate ABC transporter substrate-binding protein [Alphaproteobacteria bacterium]|nr:phosphate/phosphite/phosphonate ABC transporter substrate-binding protein [Alphaproteobacteria bacterium]